MDEVLKIGAGIIGFIVVMYIGLFSRNKKRKYVSDNRKGTDTVRAEQSDDERTNGKIETRIDTIESVLTANEGIFSAIRKRKENNQDS